MKITLSWLKDYLKTNVPLEVLCEKLTSLGLEVAHSVNWSELLNDFSIALIESCEPHPNADRLKVCRVKTQHECFQIVCGASNARKGLKVVLAHEGATIPATQMTIKRTRIRGTESCGMLCSASELDLDLCHLQKSHTTLNPEPEGIVELPPDTPLSASLAAILSLDDPVIHLDLTPNRPDFLGIKGIARELAAAKMGIFKDPFEPSASDKIESSSGSLRPNKLQHKEKALQEKKLMLAPEIHDACPRFALASFSNLDPEATLPDLERRLKALDIALHALPVNITNYILYDANRPLHAFDAQEIKGNITLRYALKDEQFEALNGNTYTLTPTDLVIADEKGLLALAGVMGAKRGSVTDQTRDLYVESAFFNPKYISRTARRLGLITDAALRFERGVDPHSVVAGLEHMAILLKGAHQTLSESNFKCQGYVYEDTYSLKPQTLSYHPLKAKELSGLSIPDTLQKEFLEKTGFQVQHTSLATKDSEKTHDVKKTDNTQDKNTLWQITVPSWRFDIDHDATIAQDMLRLYGIDQIPSTPLPSIEETWHHLKKPAPLPTTPANYALAEEARAYLMHKGLSEIITWSFIAPQKAAFFKGNEPLLELSNPLSQDMSVMRPSLIPGLLDAVLWHQKRGYELNRGVFEIGFTYHSPHPEDKPLIKVAFLCPKAQTPHWSKAPFDVFGMKALLEGLIHIFAPSNAYTLWPLNKLNAEKAAFDAVKDSRTPKKIHTLEKNVKFASKNLDPENFKAYHPGQSGVFTLNASPDKALGSFGTLHPLLLTEWECEGPLFMAELTLGLLTHPSLEKKPAYHATTQQAVTRDLGFLVDTNILAGDLLKAVRKAVGTPLTTLDVFDVFSDASKLPCGKKSLALRLTLQPLKTPFTDAEIDALTDKALKALYTFGAQLRRDVA